MALVWAPRGTGTHLTSGSHLAIQQPSGCQLPDWPPPPHLDATVGLSHLLLTLHHNKGRQACTKRLPFPSLDAGGKQFTDQAQSEPGAL